MPEGTRERLTAFGEVEAPWIEMQPGTSPRPAATLIDDQRKAGDIRDHSQQDRPEIASSAPDAGANRTREGPLRVMQREPGT